MSDKDFKITAGKKLKHLEVEGKQIPLLRVCAGVAFAEEQHHGLVILAEDEKLNVWTVAEFTTSRQEELFRLLSMAARKYLVDDGFHQPDTWASSLAMNYIRWVTDNKPDGEMPLAADPDGVNEDDAPRLISILETGVEGMRRFINPKCKALAENLRLLGQPREQLRRTLSQHPLLHALSLCLSAMAFYGPPGVNAKPVNKRRIMLHEKILAKSGRISFA